MTDNADMDGLSRIGGLVSDRKKAFAYLIERLLRSSSVVCPSCGRKVSSIEDVYLMSDNKVRCRTCRKDSRLLVHTRFSGMRLRYNVWIGIIWLFEIGTSARKAAKSIGISYNTALKAFMRIRKVIAKELAKNDTLLKGEIELDESYFGGHRKGNRGRGAAGKTIVFGILSRNDKVHVRIVPNVTRETLMKETVKKVRGGA